MNKGFTMVELLAVIIILSGIMLVAIPSIGDAASAVKLTSLENKANAISSATLKFANNHLIDNIKPAGQTCAQINNCCIEYDLYKFIIEYGIYSFDKETEEGAVIIDPVTNGKLNGSVRIKYNVNNYELEAEFIKDRIISTPSAKCV